MTAALSDLPPSDGWTTDDLAALPEDGVRRELLDGVLHASPPLLASIRSSPPASWWLSKRIVRITSM
jgi:hypothetical protein